MYPSSNNEKDENSITSQGGGDGVPKLQTGRENVQKNTTKKRTGGTPSAKKLNSRLPRNESLRLKLDESIKKETEQPSAVVRKGCVRSASVAEITPSKTVIKKKLRHTLAGAGDASTPSTTSTATLYTPRPLEGTEPQPKKCTRERFSCAVYKQLMLLAWRRTRKGQVEATKLFEQEKDQVAQLKRQNGVLSDLRETEEQKRTEALKENQKMKKIIEAFEFANTNLTHENRNLKKSLNDFDTNLSVATENISILNEKTRKMQEQLGKKIEEKKTLEDKLIIQDKELYSQKVIISHMQDTLKNLERTLKETQSNHRFKSKKYVLLKEEHKRLSEENDLLATKLKILGIEQNKLNDHNKSLQGKLQEIENSCKDFQEKIELYKFDVKELTLELEQEQKKTWVKNTKDFAVLLTAALHQIALVMLPAYREF